MAIRQCGSLNQGRDDIMMTQQIGEPGQRYKLIEPVRDANGRLRFRDELEIVREIQNLGRKMFLVRFVDGGTTCLFPNELTPSDRYYQ